MQKKIKSMQKKKVFKNEHHSPKHQKKGKIKEGERGWNKERKEKNQKPNSKQK